MSPIKKVRFNGLPLFPAEIKKRPTVIKFHLNNLLFYAIIGCFSMMAFKRIHDIAYRTLFSSTENKKE